MRVQRMILSIAALIGVLVPLIDARSYFLQDVCSDSQCEQNCQESQLPQNECLVTTGGGSAVCYCTPDHFEQDVYVFTTNCTLYNYKQSAALDTCLNGQTMYVEYSCPSASGGKKANHSHGRHEGATHVSSATVRANGPLLTPLEGVVAIAYPSHNTMGGATTTASRVASGYSKLLGLHRLKHGAVVVASSSSEMLVSVALAAPADVDMARGVAEATPSVAVVLHSASTVQQVDERLSGFSVHLHVDGTRTVATVSVPLDALNRIRSDNKLRGGVLAPVASLVNTVTREEILTLTF